MSTHAVSAATAGATWFKRADRSLLGGKTRITGNHVSPSKHKVRRCWLPNVQMKRLWSDILDRHIRINVTPYTLKQMDRMGGEDTFNQSTATYGNMRAPYLISHHAGRPWPRARSFAVTVCVRSLCPSTQRNFLWLSTQRRTHLTKSLSSLAGIDNYLLFTRPDKLHSKTGLVLRRLLEREITFHDRMVTLLGGTGEMPSVDASASCESRQDSIAAALAEIEASGQPLGVEGVEGLAGTTKAPGQLR